MDEPGVGQDDQVKLPGARLDQRDIAARAFADLHQSCCVEHRAKTVRIPAAQCIAARGALRPSASQRNDADTVEPRRRLASVQPERRAHQSARRRRDCLSHPDSA